MSYGFKVSDFDSCLFYKHTNNGLTLFAVHVDDSLLVVRRKEKLKDFLKHLSKTLKVEESG